MRVCGWCGSGERCEGVEVTDVWDGLTTKLLLVARYTRTPCVRRIANSSYLAVRHHTRLSIVPVGYQNDGETCTHCFTAGFYS